MLELVLPRSRPPTCHPALVPRPRRASADPRARAHQTTQGRYVRLPLPPRIEILPADGYSRPKAAFYAVHTGRKPGVYTTWSEAEAQVEGFTGYVSISPFLISLSVT